MGSKMSIVLLMIMALSISSTAITPNGWTPAHATFYGDMKGRGTMQGACGYGDLFRQGYGLETTALSTALFNKGSTCGACYEVMCSNSQWCVKGTVHVTATNYCPPGGLGWCNSPKEHFDLTEPMFRKIAVDKAGIVPVLYRRVTCVKRGGIKFEIKGNPDWIQVMVYNVGGVGDVTNVKIKGSRTQWIQMLRDWGQNWKASTRLVGQSLSFQVTASDGKMIELDNVAPSNWKFGDDYEGKNNFH